MVSDEVIIGEAARLVSEGVSVTLPVKGCSMLPFILGGRESVILARPLELRVGDVVLAWVNGSHYVVHRIIGIDGDRVTLMGDGNIAGTEQCNRADVKALATHVVDSKGRRHDLYVPWRLRAAKAWKWLLPVRRYILGVARRTVFRGVVKSQMRNK